MNQSFLQISALGVLLALGAAAGAQLLNGDETASSQPDTEPAIEQQVPQQAQPEVQPPPVSQNEQDPGVRPDNDLHPDNDHHQEGVPMEGEAAPAEQVAPPAPATRPDLSVTAPRPVVTPPRREQVAPAVPQPVAPPATEPATQPATQPATSPTIIATPTTKPGSPATTAPAPRLILIHEPWSYYQPLVDHNIFSKANSTRGSNSSGTSGSQKPPDRSSSSNSQSRPTWILTGVVLHAGGDIAFFENSASGMGLRVLVGQEIGDSRLVRVNPEGVDLRTGDTISQVLVGSAIDGGKASVTSASSDSIFGDSNSLNASTTQASQPAGGASGDAQSVMERMRARRRQESGK